MLLSTTALSSQVGFAGCVPACFAVAIHRRETGVIITIKITECSMVLAFSISHNP